MSRQNGANLTTLGMDIRMQQEADRIMGDRRGIGGHQSARRYCFGIVSNLPSIPTSLLMASTATLGNAGMTIGKSADQPLTQAFIRRVHYIQTL